MHDHVGVLVHRGAIIADIALNLDAHRRINADGNSMLAARIGDLPSGFIGVPLKLMQSRVEFAQRLFGKIKCDHAARSQKYGVAGSGSQTRACSMPGKSDKRAIF